MKLARFDAGNGVQVGIVTGDGIIELGALQTRYPTITSIIASGPKALRELADLAAMTSPTLAISKVRLLAPIERPAKFLAIGMNYQKHLEEAERIGVAAPARQFWFNKQTSCISGPFDDINPGVSEEVDYEVELGVVIGKPAKGVKAASAYGHIFGYVVINDVSARDWQRHSPTFTMGKSFDTHGPIGPWIVTADEVADPQNLALRCLVNGEVRQSSNTGLMIHSIAQQIEYLSTAFTLEPGDLIATGTPEGVGVGMQPQVFLEPGDVVRCEIDGIGTIENRVAG